jgi:hypothetical protein
MVLIQYKVLISVCFMAVIKPAAKHLAAVQQARQGSEVLHSAFILAASIVFASHRPHGDVASGPTGELNSPDKKICE